MPILFVEQSGLNLSWTVNYTLKRERKCIYKKKAITYKVKELQYHNSVLIEEQSSCFTVTSIM